MEKNKSLPYNFAMEAIPVLFHSQTNNFMKYIEKDGMKFLQFWWNHVGDRLPEEKRITFAGVTFSIEQIDKKTKLVIITMPTPRENEEAYFIGLIANPERRILWVRIPTATAFGLVRDDNCKEQYKTNFGYLTPSGNFRPRVMGLNPTKKDFKKLILKYISQKKAWWKK
jgi:hypothetical protein